MLIPIRCMSCGEVIGHLWEEFKKRISEGEDPKKVLDDLGIKDYCCRTVFLTHVDLVEEVGKFRE